MQRVLVVALCSCLPASLASCSRSQAPPPAPPEVYVAEVVQKDVPVYMEVVGQTRGARVEGYLEGVAFTEGSFVRKGTLLYQIDPKPLEAALANAKANLATAQARLQKADTDVNRLRPLAEEQAVSRQELDNALSAQDAARAQVDANQAAVDKATLDLGYTRITSPIDGLVGTTQVRAGNLVGRGESTLLTTVSRVDPILFRAGISEAEMLRISRRLQENTGDADPTRARKAEVQLLLADGTVHPYVGHVDAVERAVDPTTGTLTVQFSFPNPERLLRPGQYGRARFVSERKKDALLVPQRAVQELQNLHRLAVVGEGNKVEFRTVEMGPRVDDLWVVEKGVSAGEKVVVEGLQRLREGVTVVPKPFSETAAGEGVAPPASESGTEAR